MLNKEDTSNFGRFRAFAKQVVSVPKAVIDKREKAFKARKSGPKKASA